MTTTTPGQLSGSLPAVVALAVLVAWLLWPGRGAGTAQLTDRHHVLGLRARAGDQDFAAAGDARLDPLPLSLPDGPRVPVRDDFPALGVPDVVDLLVLALRSGVGVLESMEAVGGRVGGVVGKELRSVAAADRWGVDPAAAWAVTSSQWRPVAQALSIASQAGVAPAGLLAEAAAEMRRAEAARVEQATARLGVLLVLPLGLAFLPAFVLTTVVPIVLALARQVLTGAR